MTNRWPDARARRGMVASPHGLASGAGLAMLKRGGTAVDAAIAAATTIAVVYPHMNGVGGDNVWLVYDGRRRRLLGLEAIGRAAGAATLERYAAGGATIPTRGGPAALTVPGVASGWWEAYRYSYIPIRARRIAVLRRVRDHLTPDGRILISYVLSGSGPRRITWRLAQLVSRRSQSDWRPECGDVFVPWPDTRCIHLEHHFWPAEIEGEARAAGFEVAVHERGSDRNIALVPAGARGLDG